MNQSEQESNDQYNSIITLTSDSDVIIDKEAFRYARLLPLLSLISQRHQYSILMKLSAEQDSVKRIVPLKES